MRILAALAGACLFGAVLPAQELRCPASIEAEPPELARQVAGWQPVVDTTRHELANVTVYDGPVAEKASLVPDGERKVGRNVQEFWKLDPKNPRGYWLQCHYSATALTLVRAVPKGASACTVTADPGLTLEDRTVILSAVCK